MCGASYLPVCGRISPSRLLSSFAARRHARTHARTHLSLVVEAHPRTPRFFRMFFSLVFIRLSRRSTTNTTLRQLFKALDSFLIVTTPIAVSGFSHARKQISQFEAVTHCKSASWAILSGMQLTPSCDSPNTSRCFALDPRDVCLVAENPTCSVPTL